MSKGASFGSGSREPSPDGLGPSGFDPSRAEGHAVAVTVTRDIPGGFNIMTLLSVRSAMSLDEAVGWAVQDAQAKYPEHQIFSIAKVAISFRDSDGSPKGGDGEAGSVACDDSAGRQASPDTKDAPSGSDLGEGAAQAVEDVVHDILMGATALKGIAGNDLALIAKDIGEQFAGRVLSTPSSTLTPDADEVERVAAVVHAARFKPRDEPWSYDSEPEAGKEYCRRIARAVIRALKGTPPTGEVEVDSGRALREPALVASLPEPVPVSAHSGDGQARGDVMLAVQDADERMASFVAALDDAGTYDDRRELWLQAIEDSQLEADLRTLFGKPIAQEQTS